MRKIMLAAALLVATAGGADALSRYNASQFSCQQLKEILDRERAAIIRYPSKRQPGLTLYDRFIGRGGSCDGRQAAVPFSVPAAGGQSCTLTRCIQTSTGR